MDGTSGTTTCSLFFITHIIWHLLAMGGWVEDNCAVFQCLLSHAYLPSVCSVCYWVTLPLFEAVSVTAWRDSNRSPAAVIIFIKNILKNTVYVKSGVVMSPTQHVSCWTPNGLIQYRNKKSKTDMKQSDSAHSHDTVQFKRFFFITTLKFNAIQYNTIKDSVLSVQHNNGS